MKPRVNQAPRNCPVCGDVLALTRLSCDECGTELTGHFPTCEYCALTAEERDTLRVFLSSRGNMREVERFLKVSYPTARARYDAIVTKLGFKIESDEEERHPRSLDVLEQLAGGEIGVDEAISRLRAK